jgi:hypothetical protein
VTRSRWGEVREDDGEEEDDGEYGDGGEEKDYQDGMRSTGYGDDMVDIDGGMRSGISSVISGLETPADVDIRKQRLAHQAKTAPAAIVPRPPPMEDKPKEAGIVLEEVKTSGIKGDELISSSYGYKIPAPKVDSEEQQAAQLEDLKIQKSEEKKAKKEKSKKDKHNFKF